MSYHDHLRFPCAALGDAASWSRRDVMKRGSGLLLLLPLPSAACAQADVAVDLFTDIAGCNVPGDVGVIRTRGWGTLRIGAGRYVFDPRVDNAWVRSHPRSAALVADGRGFRLDSVDGDVRQYGALGDGRADDTAAINEALSHGGTITLAGPATYVTTARLLLPLTRTRLVLGPDVTLRTSPWHYQGRQTPFGNAIHITGDDCAVIGAGATSVIENVGSDANGIGFLHCGGGRVAGLVLKGGKAGVPAIADDTFQSGISIVNDRANHPAARLSRVVVEDCMVVDWAQYGVNVYGDLTSKIVIRRNTLSSNGRAGDALSVGAGIVLTRGNGPILIENNIIADNTGFGVFISSAGAEIHDVTVSHNRISRNGREGVRCTEEKHFGGSGTIGQRRVAIIGNSIEENGDAGVRAGTYDGVGSIGQMTIAGNRIANNRGSGILLQADAAVGRDVDVAVTNNRLIANADYGLAVGFNRVGLRQDGNKFERNRQGSTIDYRSGSPHPLATLKPPLDQPLGLRFGAHPLGENKMTVPRTATSSPHLAAAMANAVRG